MVKYFEELDNLDNRYLDLIEVKNFQNVAIENLLAVFMNNDNMVRLPKTWFITPFNHIYNCMSPNIHRESDLIKSLIFGIYKDDRIEDYHNYLKEIKNILKNRRLYDRDTMRFMVGYLSSNAGFYRFFEYLKNNSADYYADLDYLKKLNIDEILIKCCGFHKISSVADKVIITSCLDYEKEFYEYIANGWTIDFVKPIALDNETKRLKEYDDDFILVKRMHRN